MTDRQAALLLLGIVVLPCALIWLREIVSEARRQQARRGYQAHLAQQRRIILNERRRLALELEQRRAVMHRALDAYFRQRR